jgi:hypothetical protein
MGADKNSSPKREPDLYPEFTTKDSHTSLPRSRSHNGPTNPRNKPQMIPKRKHDSRSKGLKLSCNNPGEQSATLGRTVRGHRADDPLPTGGRSVNRNRTTRRAHNHADSPYLVLGLMRTRTTSHVHLHLQHQKHHVHLHQQHQKHLRRHLHH